MQKKGASWAGPRPMLPQNRNENLRSPEITSIPAPDMRVEPVVQPTMFQTQQSAPTSPPIYQPYISPSLDPIPLTKKITKYKKIPHILKTRKTQAAPRQVQHRLRHSLCNFGTNFCNQAAHHLVSNHLFKLPHAFHIYNKQGKK